MAHQMDEIFSYAKSNVTRIIHKDIYPAIDPTKPELSQIGQTILITGGGDNLGLSIAHAFVQAGAKAIIVIGRRSEVLEKAKEELDKAIAARGNMTAILLRTVDIANTLQVDRLWDELHTMGIIVDVLISNAAKPPQPKPILDDVDDIWAQVETNAKAPLIMTKRLCSQRHDIQKYVVNVSSAVIHSYSHPAVAARPGTVLSKTTGAVVFQQIALETHHNKLQIVSYSPGLLYNQYMKSLGLPEEQFDSRELAAAFAVFAATKEAAFLHGRFVWASWDIDELSRGELRERIEQDPYFLRSTIAPLKLGFRG